MLKNIKEAITQNEVERYEIKDKLNERFWNGKQLRSKVRMRLLDIADDFFDTLGFNEDCRIDTILTGSLCNYNWTSMSDIDLHIIVDFSLINEDFDLVKTYCDLKKNEWNTKHDTLKIYNYPIEIYVQDINEKHISHGIYSLEKNEWLIKPSHNDLMVNMFNKDDVIEKTSYIMDIIDNLDNAYIHIHDKHKLQEIYHKVNSLLLRLKKKRKTYLSRQGEMSSWNVIWKILRNCGYIEKLIVMKAKLYDKIFSIE